MNSPGERPRHSRLSPHREAEILAETLGLLEEVGYEGLAMPAVAKRARCSTATIYRQWHGKPGLVMAALRSHSQLAEPSDLDTGTLRGDLVAVMEQIAHVAESEMTLLAALAHASMRDEALAETMREQLSAPAGSPLDRAIDRAVARREISVDASVRRYCHHVFLSIPLAKHLAEGTFPDREYLVGFVDTVLVPVLSHR
ncbi:TetR/AcrR family transcriptional regulator [Arthrobacter sp. zg-ZUI100]|uniref:TetR/AcrR family transcriptional regulator n=1 Tax=Arthrobacter jiangjiafuii TaxID=2817475 RepID=UPI001AEE2CCA|nr:TetR/AcrR family transcriptional regulator [Arthrobacter jiangjiafuii]